jgi:hypothetical protein
MHYIPTSIIVTSHIGICCNSLHDLDEGQIKDIQTLNLKSSKVFDVNPNENPCYEKYE